MIEIDGLKDPDNTSNAITTLNDLCGRFKRDTKISDTGIKNIEITEDIYLCPCGRVDVIGTDEYTLTGREKEQKHTARTLIVNSEKCGI